MGKFYFEPSDKHYFNERRLQKVRSEILNDFTQELKKLILEICNREIPFTEKKI